ncbi:MAG: hypothetical protein ACI4VM_02615 [Anaerovoracaceae bacterium]
MKIVLTGSGFINPVQVIMESWKPKHLKNILVLSRDRHYISKLSGRVRVIDYSAGAAEGSAGQGGGPVSEQQLLQQAAGRIGEELKKAGDVLYIATCEPAELAALPVLQSVCTQQGIRFHILLVAPFLFQGKKQAERMKKMLTSIRDNYTSVSLYYADELLKLEPEGAREQETTDVSRKARNMYTMQKAFDALEHSVADTAAKMYRQIPRLDHAMQYTYDFFWDEFSLAVDPLQLILNMWYSIVSDQELFPVSPEGSAEAGKSASAEDGAAHGERRRSLLADVDAGKLAQLVGILNPDRDREKRKSAYTEMKKNSIPVNQYREQVGASRLDGVVERIRVMVISENSGQDPEVRRQAEERLRREIRKFQIRQEEAEARYHGEQPTEVISTHEALANVYLDSSGPSSDGTLASQDAAESPLREMRMETPYQRAARTAAQHRKKPVSWAAIQAAGASAPQMKRNNQEPPASEKTEADSAAAPAPEEKLPVSVSAPAEEAQPLQEPEAFGETPEKEHSEASAPEPSGIMDFTYRPAMRRQQEVPADEIEKEQ